MLENTTTHTLIFSTDHKTSDGSLTSISLQEISLVKNCKLFLMRHKGSKYIDFLFASPNFFTKFCNKFILVLQPITKILSVYHSRIDQLKEWCLRYPPLLIGADDAHLLLQLEPVMLTRNMILKIPTGRGPFWNDKPMTLGADEVYIWVRYTLYVPEYPLRRPYIYTWYMVCTGQNDAGKVWQR